jgi:hypothetical protein
MPRPVVVVVVVCRPVTTDAQDEATRVRSSARSRTGNPACCCCCMVLMPPLLLLPPPPSSPIIIKDEGARLVRCVLVVGKIGC